MKTSFQDFSVLANLRFQPAAGQTYAEIGGDLAIRDSRTGICYGLDPVGARIWGLLVDSNSAAEIRAILLEEYDVEPDRLECDITHLLNELSSKGLIEAAVAGAARPAKTQESISGLH